MVTNVEPASILVYREWYPLRHSGCAVAAEQKDICHVDGIAAEHSRGNSWRSCTGRTHAGMVNHRLCERSNVQGLPSSADYLVRYRIAGEVLDVPCLQDAVFFPR